MKWPRLRRRRSRPRPRDNRHGVDPRARVAHGRPHGAAAERDLLRVILHFDGWLERAREEVRPEWFEGLETREILDLALGAADRQVPLDRVERLSPAAQLLWNDLMAPMPGVDEPGAADMYLGAREYLEARPAFQEFDSIQGAAERATRRKELLEAYPLAARKYFMGQVGKRLRQPSK